VLLAGSVAVAARLTDSSFVLYSITLATITSAGSKGQDINELDRDIMKCCDLSKIEKEV